MMICLSPEITALVEGQEYAAQVIVVVIEEGKDYRGKRFNNIVMIAKPLTFLLALTFLFSYEGVCDSKTIHPYNDNEFSNFDIQGLTSVGGSEHFIEYKRSFCGQYSMRIIRADNNEVMDTILAETSNLIELPTYGSAKFGRPHSIILSNNSNPLIIFKGVYISLKCEDITSDGNPELFVDINYAGGNASVTQYIFSMDEFNLLLDTSESGVSWYEGGLHQKMEDLNGDGVKEYNGWKHFWDLVGVCSTCRKPPGKIMCFDSQAYVDCTKKFPALLQKDLNESRKRLRSSTKYFREHIDSFHTELIFFISTSVNLNKKEETLDYIKTNFSQETFDWVKENMDKILKELDS